MRRVILILTLLSATAASAQTVTTGLHRPVSERARDGAGVLLCEAVGAFGGLFLGAVTVSQIDPESLNLSSAVHISLLSGVAGAVGGLLVFDALSDGDGSVATGLAGQAAGVALYAFGYHRENEALIYSGLGTVLLGGALGYALRDHVETRPLVSAVPDGKGGTQYALGLRGAF